MGKRKLNATSFYQCDWTGYPMKHSYCYLPEWSACNKLQKKGSYCNWESVVAHAAHLQQRGDIDAAKYERILEHVTAVCGTTVEPAPHYELLAHVKGNLTMENFHALCTTQRHPIVAVKITPQGEVFEVLLNDFEGGNFAFANYLHKPYASHKIPSCFHSMRKKDIYAARHAYVTSQQDN